MLRIQTNITPEMVTVTLEGKLIQPWTFAFEQAFSDLRTRFRADKIYVIDIGMVVFVDRDGRVLLRSLHRAGVQVIGSDLFVSAVIGEN